MSQSPAYRRSKRLSAALACSVIALGGLSACGGSQVLITSGKNAGKRYAPPLVGGMSAEECIRQGVCTADE